MLSPLVVYDRYGLAGVCRSSDDILVPPTGASSFKGGFVRHDINVVSGEVTSSVGWEGDWQGSWTNSMIECSRARATEVESNVKSDVTRMMRALSASFRPHAFHPVQIQLRVSNWDSDNGSFCE